MTSTLDLSKERMAIATQELELERRKRAVVEEERQQAREYAKTITFSPRQLEEMRTKHEELVGKCRFARDEYHRLVAQTDRLSIEARNAGSAMQSAAWRYSNQLAAKPKPGDYPTAKEMEDWRRELNHCEAEKLKVEKAGGEAWAAYERSRINRIKAQADFDQLATQEDYARSALERLPTFPAGGCVRVNRPIG